MSSDALAPPDANQVVHVRHGRVPAAVTDMIYSANHRDIEGLLDCFQSTGLVIQSGHQYVGKEAIQNWAVKTFIRMDASLSQLWFAMNGDNAAVRTRMKTRQGSTARTFVFDMDGALIRTLHVIF